MLFPTELRDHRQLHKNPIPPKTYQSLSGSN
jgi:hypothetical protein